MQVLPLPQRVHALPQVHVHMSQVEAFAMLKLSLLAMPFNHYTTVPTQNIYFLPHGIACTSDPFVIDMWIM